MPRNAEITRQWKILRALEGARTGKTLEALAELGSVCTRTVRRDLAALQEAGFALYDERNEDGRALWKLDGRPFRNLEQTSFTIAELASLYFSRTLLECAVAEPFQEHLKAAFERLDKALSPHMHEFLARLPAVLTAKRAPVRREKGDDQAGIVKRIMEATVAHRKVVITYHSFSSRKIKDYHLEPYRLAYGDGALYLFAFVLEYQQMRTFAVKRIKKLEVLEETFRPIEKLSREEPFGNSVGVHHGNAEHVEIEFDERAAPYVKERPPHKSQTITQRADGSIVVSLDVCLDRALTSWILGFGPFARVLAPPKLVEQIYEEIEEARDVYAPTLFPTEPPNEGAAGGSRRDSALADSAAQHVLPFARKKRHKQPA